MRKSVVTISNMNTKEFFFSTNHCQEHGLGDEWVPCTYRLPMQVEPRTSLPDGNIRNVRQLVDIFYDDMVEIPNPDVNFQPVFSN